MRRRLTALSATLLGVGLACVLGGAYLLGGIGLALLVLGALLIGAEWLVPDR